MFHMKFRIVFSGSVEYIVGILIESALSLFPSFRRMVVLTILVLSRSRGHPSVF